jgi:metallophosphoesterase superfamily enzyme
VKDIRPRLNLQEKKALDYLRKKETRVLVVGDIHCPFEHKGYFQFCVDTYERFNCNRVVMIGDCVDHHYSSYHETDSNGMGGGYELAQAIEHLKKWTEKWPDATVTIGNHDRLIARKAFSSSVPREWIKDYNEVLGTTWTWVERVVIDGVQYVHGEAGTARTKAKNDMQSTVQGHIHTQAYCEHYIGNNTRIFGMQIGCGIDRTSYSQAFAKNYKKQALGCGVVIGGHTPINVLFDE